LLTLDFVKPFARILLGTTLLSELLIANFHMPARMAKYGNIQPGIRWQVRKFPAPIVLLDQNLGCIKTISPRICHGMAAR
jgi:hypothetical protein